MGASPAGFLGPSVYAERHRDLDRHLDEILPETFAGFPVRFVFPDGAAPRHWVAVTDVATYFADYLGVTEPDELLHWRLAERADAVPT